MTDSLAGMVQELEDHVSVCEKQSIYAEFTVKEGRTPLALARLCIEARGIIKAVHDGEDFTLDETWLSRFDALALDDGGRTKE